MQGSMDPEKTAVKMDAKMHKETIPPLHPVTLNDYYNVPDVPKDSKMVAKLKRKIMKNLCLIAVVFLCNFAAYNGLGNLQSSLHKDEGMGTINQSLVYGSIVLSALFLPKLLMSVIGPKWTIPVGMIGYILWMAANGYAVWGTMVPASILVGICASLMWTAQGVYFTKIVPKYAALTGETPNAVTARLFGIFFAIFQVSNIIGSTISSTVLGASREENENTTLSSDEIQMYCGINYCPDTNITNPNQDKPSSSTLWTLVGVYIGVACVGLVIICTAVDDLPQYLHDTDKAKARREARESAVKTALHLRNKTMCLIVPLTIFNGLEEGFNGAEWNNAYVTCSLGIWMVGFINIPAGAMNGLIAITGGHLVKYTGRIPIYTTCMLVYFTVQFILIFWPLDPDKNYVFFLIALTRAVGDGIMGTFLSGFYGTCFADNSEAAFSNSRLWQAVGNIITFAYSSFVCTDIKLYICMVLLVVSSICYYLAESVETKKNKRKRAESLSSMSKDPIKLDETHFGKDNYAVHLGPNDPVQNVPGISPEETKDNSMKIMREGIDNGANIEHSIDL